MDEQKPSSGLSDFAHGHDLNPEDKVEDRGPAIHLAVLEGNTSVVDELLRLYHKDCIEAKDIKGRKRTRTPLHNAAQLGLRDIVAKLLQKGADVDARTKAQWTALILASDAGKSEVVKSLLKSGANVHAQATAHDAAGGRGDVTAMHVAAELKSPHTILQLLWNGGKHDVTTQNGDTPLHFALKAGSLPTTAMLLFHGASITNKNKDGISPQDLINKLQKKNKQKFQHLLACGGSNAGGQDSIPGIRRGIPFPDLPKVLHYAVSRNLDSAVAYLLHIDPRLVEATSPRGWHPLHVAARDAASAAARVLLNHGAEVDCLTNNHWTPLMLAAENDNVELIQVLIEKHANRLLRNKYGDNADSVAKNRGLSIPVLAPPFRHVPSQFVPRPNSSGSEPATTNSLPVPKQPISSREPSPGWNEKSELEGELYALSDANVAESSATSLKCPEHVERLFQALERTWYERIQWSPEDDVKKSHGLDWSGPVKIAILDTGIDVKHDDFQRPARRRSKIGKVAASRLVEKSQCERIKACKNFVGGPGEEDDVTDTSGHGTHIAGIILSIAPRAELYIAKTSSGDEEIQGKPTRSASTTPRRKSRWPVQEALQWAIDQGVDIVNLSLGFPEEGSYELTRILEDANHKGIIVFAAAANHGNRDAIAWPARDRDLAICVTSGDKLNNRSQFAPGGNQSLPVFVTCGEDIWSQWPTKLGGGFRTMSGTSVATPIAVAMAAMILAFLNSTNAWPPGEKRQWLERSKERRLRSTRGMGRLLEHICRDRSGLKILSPKLMWEENPRATQLQALSCIAQAFKVTG